MANLLHATLLLLAAAPATDADLSNTEGVWASENAPDQLVIITHTRESGKPVRTVIRLKVGGAGGVLDYIGEVGLEVRGGNLCFVFAPVIAGYIEVPETMPFKVDGGRLVLWVGEGKYKGAYTFKRAKGG
jgi:hypothetical protein